MPSICHCSTDTGYYNNDRYYGRSNYYDPNYRGNGYDNLSPEYYDRFRDFGYSNYNSNYRGEWE